MNSETLTKITIEFNKKRIEFKQFSKDIEVYAYSQDASTISIQPQIVVFPTSAEQLKDIIKICKNNNVSITARGSGTNLVGNALSSEIVADLSRLNNIIEINEKEKFAIVEPGVICNVLNEMLKRTIFPVIPSSHRVCTIGGMINCNSAGNWSLRFGKVENWIDEVLFLDGNGNGIASKEIIGSEGTFGIIVKAKLKLIEKPRIKIESKEYENVEDMLKDMKHYKKNDKTIMLEVIDKKSTQLILGCEKIVLLAGLLDETADDEYERILRIREKAYPTLAEQGFILIEDPQIDEENLEPFLRFLEKNNIPYFGHIGSGIIHPCFKKNQKDLIKKMYSFVGKLNGKVSGEHGIGLKKAEFANKIFLENIANLKFKYDPQNIFNRELFNTLSEKLNSQN